MISTESLLVNYSTDPDAIKINVQEEDALKNYPYEYEKLTVALNKRYTDFKDNQKYHNIRKPLIKIKKCYKTRLLDPNNSKSPKKDWYGTEIFKEFHNHTLKNPRQRRTPAGTIDFINPSGVDFNQNQTVTGYLLGKFVDPAVYDATGLTLGAGQGNQPWIHLRYAEILLNYAEAINEAQGPGNANDAVNLIRTRAGMPVLPAGLNQTAMRFRIQNERKVELSFEEQRFWDVRRWKIASITNNITAMDVSITKDGSNTLQYNYVVPNTGGNLDYDPVRVFKEANYFFPIPLSEIAADLNLTQNPGY